MELNPSTEACSHTMPSCLSQIILPKCVPAVRQMPPAQKMLPLVNQRHELTTNDIHAMQQPTPGRSCTQPCSRSHKINLQSDQSILALPATTPLTFAFPLGLLKPLIAGHLVPSCLSGQNCQRCFCALSMDPPHPPQSPPILRLQSTIA